MAVRIDSVYQKVLALANKEQRGYITPQEFNLFANHAQMEIFEQYFYDENQFGRSSGNSTEYSDMLDLLNEKISIFKTREILSVVSGAAPYPLNLYRIGGLYQESNQGLVEIPQVNQNELSYIQNSLLLSSSRAYTTEGETIYVHPVASALYSVELTYVKKPALVEWNYSIVGEHALYDNGLNSVDFELHPSEEGSLVIKILSLAGVTLKDPGIYQIASTEESKKIQQEKQ
tara:strand:+ start:33 stop:725 length:693 start_codon:yes stop_codon:yes gene_type:complete